MTADPGRGPANPGYVPAIDGLRAVAILVVLVFHLRPLAMPSGLLGVDLFFVISGFVVTASLQGRRFAGLGDLISYFYARRIRRVLPALLATLLAGTVLTGLFMRWAWALTSTAPEVAAAAAIGASNLVFAFGRDPYGALAEQYTPFFHTWSLGVEEQFYLLFPFLVFLLRGAGRRGAAIVVVAGLAAASLWLAFRVSAQSPVLGFFLMPTRFWELGAGMILCLTVETWRPRLQALPPLVRDAACGASLAAFLWVCLTAEPAGWPLLQLTAVLVSALLVVLCSAGRDSAAARALSSPPILYTGRISYSLYLWHVPIYVLFKGTVGLDGAAAGAAALAATFAAAALSYRYVETPFRRLPTGERRDRRRILAGGGAAAALTAGAVWLLATPRTPISFARDLDGGRSGVLESWRVCNGGAWSARIAGRIVATSGECGRPVPGPRLFVIGDSHAAAYSDMVLRFARETGVEVRLHSTGGCPFPPLDRLGRSRCHSWYASATARLAGELRPGDLIFLSSLHMRRTDRQWGAGDVVPPLPTESERAAALAAARARLGVLAATGARILIEAPKPVFPSSPYRCSNWFNRSNPVCAGGFTVSRDRQLAAREPVLAAMRRLAAEVPGTSIWDPFPILCPAEPCSAVAGEHAVFLDDNHLGPFGTDLLYADFVNTLARNGIAARRRSSGGETSVPPPPKALSASDAGQAGQDRGSNRHD